MLKYFSHGQPKEHNEGHSAPSGSESQHGIPAAHSMLSSHLFWFSVAVICWAVEQPWTGWQESSVQEGGRVVCMDGTWERLPRNMSDLRWFERKQNSKCEADWDSQLHRAYAMKTSWRPLWWGCATAPTDTHILITGTYECVYGKRDFVDMIKLRILRWSDYPRLSG